MMIAISILVAGETFVLPFSAKPVTNFNALIINNYFKILCLSVLFILPICAKKSSAIFTF
ncbi:hypothetical protein F0Q32_03860 [Pseudocitrobacter sp. 73]|nr:hypothetical protein F0Q32_03860 [Pseudocitrobacter sp. 73]